MNQANIVDRKLIAALVITLFAFSVVSYSLEHTAEAAKVNIKSNKHKQMVRNKICGNVLCSQKNVQHNTIPAIGHLAAKNNTKCVNPPGGPQYC
jgi:hypothetical protein